MSWEEDFDQAHFVANPFAGEDEDTTIPDAWDAVEEPELPPPQPVKKPEQLPKSKLLAKELKEKELKKQLKQKEEKTAPLSEKDRENFAKSQEYELFKDVLEVKATVVGLDDFVPTSKDEFERLNHLARKKFLALENSPHYHGFLENFFRDLVISSDVDNLKRLSTMFSALANEKSKLQKATGKKKKAVKGAKLAKVRADDVTNYDDDDDLDFDEEY